MSLLLSAALALAPLAQEYEAFRPPAVPLVVHDPYFSVWSPHDELTDGWTTHWTGREQRLCGLVRIDGKAYRVLGPDFFEVLAWDCGPAGFGTEGTPGAVVGTRWDSADVWLRRSFELPEAPEGDVRLWVHHDEDAEIYLNGVLAAEVPGYVTNYEPIELSPEARAALRAGTNFFAVHCRQTVGGQYIDVGLVRARPASEKK